MKLLLFLFSVKAFNLLFTVNGCTIDGQVRLVDGSTPYEGRVEICNNAVWGTVCDSLWGSNDNAQVVCRQLGYTTAGAQYKLDAYYGQGNGSVLLDGVRCYGYERNLLECSHYPNTSCYHSDDVGVQCTPYKVKYNCTTGSIRLVDGSNRHEGRVEICVNGVWGTICSHHWSSNDAKVVCYQLGYSKYGAIAYSDGHFRSGDGSIFLDNVQCLGTESNLLDCSRNVIGVHDCSDRKDAGVACQVKDNCTTGSLRLIAEPNTHKGRVEICMDGVWGTVCSRYWDSNDASVACYQLGYSKIGAVGYAGPSSSKSDSSILLSSVQCNGKELNLLNCSHTKTDYCYRGEAKVNCTVKGHSNCTSGSIRLVNGSSDDEGRVEICMDGIWGSICGNNWGYFNSKVACRQLGYSKYGDVDSYRVYYAPQGKSPIIVSSFGCYGDESSLLDCSLGYNRRCSSYVAGVRCQNVLLTPPQKAGIISGSVLLFIISCCMCIVFTCLWKRRKYRKYSYLQQQKTSSLNCDDSDIELKQDTKDQASLETSKSNENGLQDITDK